MFDHGSTSSDPPPHLMQHPTGLHGRMSELAQTWRDQEQAKFTEEFEQTMKVLMRFLESSEKHIPFLLRKADRIDEYLQQR
jgi:hypothetical protein